MSAMADQFSALEQLTAMRERGLITATEFDAKRAEILNRLTPPPPLAPLVTPPPAPQAIPAPAAQPKKSETSAGGALITLLVLLGGAWYFFGRGDAGGGSISIPDPAWSAPAGYTKYDGDAAYKWIETTGDCLGNACWAMEVVTRTGCPNALYVELSLQDAQGTAVGFANDVAGVLTAGQKARLTFDSLGTQGARKAILSSITCY